MTTRPTGREDVVLDEDALSRQVLSALSDGIVVLGLDGTVLYANPSAATLLRTENLVGRSVDEFLDQAGRGQAAYFLAEAAQGRFLPEEVDTMLVRDDGQALWVRLRQTAYLEDGAVAGLVLRLTDNDETKRLLELAHAGHRALVRAERIGRSGSWTWDFVTGTVTASEGLEELYGDQTSVVLGQDREALVRITHPDDQARLVQALDGLLSGTGPKVDVEVRHLGRHGWMWVRLRAVGTYDAAGTLKEASGTYQDITRARATEDRLQDLVTQTSLMQTIATAANTAATLDEILQQAGALVVLHDDWDRARAFVPAPDGAGVVPHALDPFPDGDPEVARIEEATAAEAFRAVASVWDPVRRLTLACPVTLDGDVLAILVMTSLPPLHRHDMIQKMVEEAATLLSRVAERERAERELADARDRALEASRHKSEFLATMSHEIRTPLNGIIGLNELLDSTALSAVQRDYVAGITVSSRTLLELINDVLDFSKIEAGLLEVESVDLDVRAVLGEVGELLAESARHKGIALDLSCADDVPAVAAGDPTRLRQVLLNLGSNAVKFTAAGSVAIRATAAPDGDATLLRVEVRDTGIGISAEQQQRIFAPFSQADSSTTRHFGGSGLGLAISAEIVAALGGEIGVDSSPGVGSTFWFTARLGAAVASVREASAPSRAGVVRDAGGRRLGTVLVVEDNEINRLVARGFLEALGFAVDTADDGLAALEMLDSQAYDAVLLDLQMPRLDGYATARAVREREARAAGAASRVPMIAVTATAIAGEREKCLAAGMDDFLTKPLSPTALGAALERWLGAASPSSSASSASAAGPVSPHLDLERLAMLLELVPGDTSYLDRAIGRFLDNGGEFVGLVASAAASSDAPALSAAAHALRGSASNLGLVVLADVAAEVEELARTGTTVGAEQLVAELGTAMGEAVSAISEYRDWYQSA
ncbi:ATP-binding protein [Nocardioides sp. C4-1]|uniref:PAS domain-containing hybrid sensor histidine kinase/response regulator n=1 Tax=Nocardioides sp. C4-1 TaxID=3151851 RepID=UPI003264ABF8